MDDDTTTKSSKPKISKTTADITTTTKNPLKSNNFTEKRKRIDEEDYEDEECGDVEVWNTLRRSFKQVQTVLDKNRELIRTANQNHQSKIPDNIAGNVSIIQQINGNISKVVKIYSDLSVDFSAVVRRRRRSTTPSSDGDC